jgi:hypothetical protein
MQDTQAHIIVAENKVFSFSQTTDITPQRTPEALTGDDTGHKADIAFWGNSNTYPEEVLTAIRSNPDLISGLDFKARALAAVVTVAGGVQYEALQKISGKWTYSPIIEPEIEHFLRINQRYFFEAASDFYKFFNAFPEIILTSNRKSIYFLSSLNTRFCRYSLVNETTNQIPYVYYSARFKNGHAHYDSELDDRIPLIDPLGDEVEELRQRQDSYRYVYPLSYPTNNKYYQLAHWESIIQSKWLALANKIPAYKNAIMDNQVSIRVMVTIPSYYWQWKYKNWEMLTPEEQAEKREEEYKVGSKNSFF